MINISELNSIRRIGQKVNIVLLLFSILTSAFILIPGIGFAQDHQNDWFYNPFNQYSAHHRPIGAVAIYADKDHPAVQDWLQGSQMNINAGETPWGLHFFASEPDGPVKTVTIRECAPINPGHFPVNIRFPHNADAIMPDHPCNTDGPVGIYNRASGTYHELFKFSWNDGNPQAAIHRHSRLDDLGHGSELAKRPGTSATGTTRVFGLLREWEIMKTGHPIGHALAMVLPYQSSHSMMMLGREVWWPAVGMDGAAYTNPEHNTGNIPYGSLWAIPPVSKGGPDLDTLGLTEKGKRLAETIRDYGIYVVDGGGHPSIRGDQNFSQALRSELVNETRKFYPYLRMVLNSVPDDGKVVFNVGDRPWAPSGPVKKIIPGEFPAGGGTPLAPNTAIDLVTSIPSHSSGKASFFETVILFPNPAKDRITIIYNENYGPVKLEVLNVLGQEVSSKNNLYSGANLILPDKQGAFFIRLITNLGSETYKIMKL